MDPTPSAPRLVLLTLGSASDPAGPALLLPDVAARLSNLCGLPLRSLPASDDPSAALAGLSEQPGAWLAPLTLDPGLCLSGGSWAEALGAWRQPCLLVMESTRLATGLPAAATALLQRWGVPLGGLIQWEGHWDSASRRRDGLPWLGRLGAQPGHAGPEAESVSDADAMVRAALALRWRQLVAMLA